MERNHLVQSSIDREWLETDGLGGFASGTVSGKRTRRYHATLLTATTPPTGRVVLVNGFDAWIETAHGTFPLTTQCYAPGTLYPDGSSFQRSFDSDPWPCWRFDLGDGLQVEQQLFLTHGSPTAVISWRTVNEKGPVKLIVRPYLSGRDFHSTHHENSTLDFNAEIRGSVVVWKPYASLPCVVSLSNGEYSHKPYWYRNFLYEEERERGLDPIEDLASPGVFEWDLSKGEAVWILAANTSGEVDSEAASAPLAAYHALRRQEITRRLSMRDPLERAADKYLVQRRKGKTIVAGYPWFSDWGRDTLISLRGLCLATGRIEEAKGILLEWANAVSEGMLPNFFPDAGQEPEYNSVDASLWFVIAVHELFEEAKKNGTPIAGKDRETLRRAVLEILRGYYKGTRFGIHCDTNGLLAAGEPGVQLTWMDAKVGDWVVTPRIGKPVEIQALWLNALWIASRLSEDWTEVFHRGFQSFEKRFWNESKGCLYDVVDSGHVSGNDDATIRPNQIFAVGGLPLPLLRGDKALRVLEVVHKNLWTPLGLRSLAPDEPGYTPAYWGGPVERDGAYHQGTVWPWLIGAFIEAWIRVHGDAQATREEARGRFLLPLLDHLGKAGIGHVSEVADAEPPHKPRGCPFQAWSLAEVIRLKKFLESEPPSPSNSLRLNGNPKAWETQRERELVNV